MTSELAARRPTPLRQEHICNEHNRALRHAHPARGDPLSNEVINWALKYEIIGNAPRKLILFLLANRADEAWECWPSVGLLAEESGLSVSQVRRHLQALESEQGVIRRIPWQRKDGSQGANGFVIGGGEHLPSRAFMRREGGHTCVGGLAPKRASPTRGREALNPHSKPSGDSSISAARGEPRRRSSAKAADDKVTEPTITNLCEAIRGPLYRQPDELAQHLEVVRDRLPATWKEAEKQAIARHKEIQNADEPKKAADDRTELNQLAYQYVIHLRAPNWPAWLLGPLLPFVESAKAT